MPLCLFCTGLPQKKTLFRGGQQVPGWNPACPWGSAGRSKIHFWVCGLNAEDNPRFCGWMLPQSKGFSRFLFHIFQEAAAQWPCYSPESDLSSGPCKCILQLQINTVFSFFWGEFFFFLSGDLLCPESKQCWSWTHSILSPSLTISSNIEPNAALGVHFGVSFLFPRPPRARGSSRSWGGSVWVHVRKRENGSIDAFLEKGVRISPKKGAHLLCYL